MSAAPAVLPEALASFMHASVREAVRDALFFPLSLGERHDIRLKPGFHTACWSYLPPHRIYVGTAIFDQALPGLSERGRAQYVRAHVHHELAHAHFTERNLRQVQKELGALGVPFALFNLLEDARIEARYREETGYRFQWLTCEPMSEQTSPAGLFFALIQAEGDVRRVRRALTAQAKAKAADAVQSTEEVQKTEAVQAAQETEDPKEVKARFARVLDYYTRVVVAPDSAALYPIAQQWLAEFGQPQDCPARGNEQGAGASQGEGATEAGAPGATQDNASPSGEAGADLAIGAALQADPLALAEFEHGTVALEAAPDKGDADKNERDQPTAAGGPRKVQANPALVGPVSQRDTVLHKHASALDEAGARKVAQRLGPFFSQKVRMEATHTPQRRLSARAWTLERAPYRRRTLEGKARRRIALVIDCSGSMNGHHIEQGRTLVHALSMLAQSGHVEGHVILSAVLGRTSSWETWALPMPEQSIARIQGYAGAEGLEGTMKGNLDVLRAADFVFVYTDAQICDQPIRKADFHRYALYTWGLYASAGQAEPQVLESLQNYFDKAIVRQDALALADAMLTQR